MGNGARYLDAEGRIRELAEVVPDDLCIAATPGWTFRELLAHLVGVAADLVEGRVSQWAAPTWTAGHVRDRASCSRVSLFEEWATLSGAVAEVIDDPVGHGLHPLFGVMPVVDVIAHEYDVREAAGAPRMLAEEDWAVIGPHRYEMLKFQVTSADLPALGVCTHEGDEWIVGHGDLRATVIADRGDLWRSLEGRRTRTAVRSFAWTTDPEPYVAVWVSSNFRWVDDGAP